MDLAQQDLDIQSLKSPEEIRLAAKKALPVGIFDFIDGGAGDESTLLRNTQAIADLSMTGRLLRGGFTPSTQTQAFGQNLDYPIAIAPMAYHGMVTPLGEIATARAAASAGIPLILSTMSTVSFEALKEVGASVWFQLYAMKDEQLTHSMIDEAVAGGCELLVLTIDVPVFGRRLRDERNRFRPCSSFTRSNKVRQAGAKRFGTHILELEEPAFVEQMFKLDLNWQDIAAICAYSPVPVVLKGVMSPQEALHAKSLGVAGVIVSNHGGRQFDSHPASLSVLPKVAQAWCEPGKVAVDGGFASASDVLKGLASGADLVLLGRTVLFALAAGGEALLTQYLRELTSDIRRNMTLMGLADLSRASLQQHVHLLTD